MSDHDQLPRADTAPERRLGSSSGKLSRISHHTQGLVEGLRHWMDLRIELVRAEVAEQVNEAGNRLVLLIISGIAALFALVTLAVGLGWWLGHLFWGFLIVTALLTLVAAAIAITKPTWYTPTKNEEPPSSKHYETRIEKGAD